VLRLDVLVGFLMARLCSDRVPFTDNVGLNRGDVLADRCLRHSQFTRTTQDHHLRAGPLRLHLPDHPRDRIGMVRDGPGTRPLAIRGTVVRVQDDSGVPVLPFAMDAEAPPAELRRNGVQVLGEGGLA
jgi:hypothetical protein